MIEHKARNDSVLIWSIRWGHFNIVKALIDQGADIHTDDNLPFITACHYGRLEIAEYLITKGAYIYSRDNKALELAHKGCENSSNLRDHINIVKLLIEYGVRDSSTLIWACKNGYIDIVKRLIEHEIKDSLILIWASQYGHFDIVQLLVESGEIDIRSQDNEAIKKACQNDHMHIAKYLLERI